MKAITIILTVLILATVSVAWAGPIDWIDEKVTEFIKDKSGVKVVEDKLRDTEQELARARQEIENMKARVRIADAEKQRAEIQHANLMALMWKVPAAVFILTLCLMLVRLGFRKAFQNRE